MTETFRPATGAARAGSGPAPADKQAARLAPVPLSAPKPGCPDWHDGEWLCVHPPCPVRTVVLRVRYGRPFRLPRLRCPLCLRSLAFRQWLTPWT